MDKVMELAKAIASSQTPKNKTSSYDTTATVKRIEGNTAWIHISDGVPETPAVMAINAKEGDTVRANVSGGGAYIIGNVDNPPTDDSYAKQAEAQAIRATQAADAATEQAGIARRSADSAVRDATTAKESANTAVADAATARESAESAVADASTAREMATQAAEDAETAAEAATNAEASASAAATSASNAATSASNAATSASNAATSASNAATSASSASNSASSAGESASRSQAAAEAAQLAALATITTDTLHYLATSASSGVTRQTSGWTTTVQAMTSANRYLWTYHTYTSANGGTTDTDPIITGVYGEQGSSGDDGATIWTTTTAPTTPNYTFTISTLSGVTGLEPKVGDVIIYSYYRYQISSVDTTTVRSTTRVSIRGATGAAAKWYTGTGITGTSTTATIFAGSGVSSAVVGDMYLNSDTNNTYRCTTAGAPSAAKWVYVDNIQGEQGIQGIQGVQGEKGDKGDKGDTGDDGHSPVVTASKSGDTTTIKVDGTTVATILDGSDGSAGHSPTITTSKSGTTTTIYADGVAIGTVDDGTDGTTPSITATKSGTTTTVKVNGTTIATINDGAKGDTGDDGVSVTAVQPQYYLSTSSSSATGGSWSTSLSYVVGKYIWTRDMVTYSDNTSAPSTAIYNEALTQSCKDAAEALGLVEEQQEYFWHDSLGAHVLSDKSTVSGTRYRTDIKGAGLEVVEIGQTDTSVAEFGANGSRIGAEGASNVITDSNGIAIRDGLTELATFGANGVTLGKAGEQRTHQGSSGLAFVNENNYYVANIRTESPSPYYQELVIYNSTTTNQIVVGNSISLTQDGRDGLIVDGANVYLTLAIDEDLYTAITALGWQSEVIV